MGGAVGLAAVFAALLFDLGVEFGETLAFALGFIGTIEFGVDFGEIEMNFGAGGIDLGGSLQFLQGVFELSRIQ